MNRRTFLAAGGVVAAGTVAGCLSDDDPTADYRTETWGGEEVQFAPLEHVHEWYEDDAVELVDTRSQRQYAEGHVAGAVLSPAPDGFEEDDPVASWPTDTRIVTYCTCPTSLAGLRAAALIGDGYEEVYGLEEGFDPWRENGYPVETADESVSLETYVIRGRSDPVHAGEYVFLTEPATDQREISPVQDDGSYLLEAGFVDVSPATRLELEAPDYALEATLAELTSGVVTG
ncbi:rhodanese-like domain-containing protein [Natronobeatus ordinarius]|uniref:rhodanese-like domain-containing protein n=1 Tax=Natronobeatus ordinarius TaxID=2963433 RepID=UPI0020CDB88A|nr:rhodanese-like domain-containing protein [Natronobeatus ordinarius]